MYLQLNIQEVVDTQVYFWLLLISPYKIPFLSWWNKKSRCGDLHPSRMLLRLVGRTFMAAGVLPRRRDILEFYSWSFDVDTRIAYSDSVQCPSCGSHGSCIPEDTPTQIISLPFGHWNSHQEATFDRDYKMIKNFPGFLTFILHRLSKCLFTLFFATFIFCKRLWCHSFHCRYVHSFIIRWWRLHVILWNFQRPFFFAYFRNGSLPLALVYPPLPPWFLHLMKCNQLITGWLLPTGEHSHPPILRVLI